MAKKKTYIIANWKMNPLTAREAKKLFTGIKKVGGKAQNVQTVVCPPALFIPELQKQITGQRVVLGAQNAFPERTGAFTGNISAAQIKKAGVHYVIVGHSEQRAQGETDAYVNKKIKAALKEGLKLIICIGEQERDEGGAYLRVIEEQLRSVLAGVQEKHLDHMLITYEPVWAISSNTGSKAEDPEDTEETVLYIRKILASMFTKKRAFAVPMLYGGSSNPQNAEAILTRGGVQGLLVGGASLNAKSFGEMIRIADAL